MKYIKMLGLAAVAAAALMAFVGAGTASAAGVLCSAQEAPCGAGNKWGTQTLEFSASASTLLRETSLGETINTCRKSFVSGTITNGNSSSNASGSISSLTWTECTWTTTTVANGGLEVVSAGSHDGAVRANAEVKVTISIPFFGSCVYGVTAGTILGTITEGNPATFDSNAVVSKSSGSSITCPNTANWTGTYTQTVPSGTTLSVEAS
jgi:hypothetical protein